MTETRQLPYLAFFFRLRLGHFRFDAHGKVLNGKGKIAARPNRNGYFRVPFCFLGKRYEVMEHVACFIHFHGKWPVRGQQVNHKDLNRANGSPCNLELVSQGENLKHAWKMRKRGVKGGKR